MITESQHGRTGTQQHMLNLRYVRFLIFINENETVRLLIHVRQRNAFLQMPARFTCPKGIYLLDTFYVNPNLI